jgi:hypothetical protein
MGYQEAMEAAGAEVHAFEYFGSYQGDYLAKVAYEGKTFFVHGSYGSCSGCDAFQAEFGYSTSDGHVHNGEAVDYYYGDEVFANCSVCAETFEKLKVFGQHELNSNETYDELRAKLLKDNWYSDGKAMLEWLEKNK